MDQYKPVLARSLHRVASALPVSNPFPLGATVSAQGTNFSIFSASATGMRLVLFDHPDDPSPARTITLDPVRDRTSHYWHVFVQGIEAGQLYGYRADGPNDPAAGQRFDHNKILLDPYGQSVSVGQHYSRAAASAPGDNASTCMKSMVADLSHFDWEGDRPINRAFRDTVIYEMHIAGFTRHPSSGVPVPLRGTYLGVIEKIPYLTSLGITAVELLPVFQFDRSDAPGGLINYWGYDPISFFAPHLAYGTRKDEPLACLDEFRTMVKALHRAGIEVILDVVYNHTAEGNEDGPTLCFRGLENSFYYILGEDKATYADFTGTGNTLKANHSVVKRLILDSLRYWVSEMHVDGFRFDLASIFSRSVSGKPVLNAPIIWEIDSEPVLAGTKLIAEAWDSGGLYQVGSFGQDKWKEWNGTYRDDVRSFLKGDPRTVCNLRERFLGSPDIYKVGERPTGQSINFVTCHDGFTLNDLVSFNEKHNDGNRSHNQDGTNANLSWNCGAEGPSLDPEIQRLRIRQIKNFLALTLLSIGTPMLLMGDEVRRTQQGNNNAYCLDSDVSWFDWELCNTNAEILRFAKEMIRVRLHFDQGTEGDPIPLEEYLCNAHVEWHGAKLCKPDWGNDSHSIAVSLHNYALNQVRYIAINSYWHELEFELPPFTNPSCSWTRMIDTFLPTPDDIVGVGQGATLTDSRYLVRPRSIVVLHQALPDSK
jgi:glycogen operon protein